MEGRRVDAEIERELREARQGTGPGDDFDDALGKTVPRESDKQKLAELDDKIKNQKRN